MSIMDVETRTFAGRTTSPDQWRERRSTPPGVDP